MFLPDELSRTVARSLRDHPEDWSESFSGNYLIHKNGDRIWLSFGPPGIDVVPKDGSMRERVAYEVTCLGSPSQRHIHRAVKRWSRRKLQGIKERLNAS